MSVLVLLSHMQNITLEEQSSLKLFYFSFLFWWGEFKIKKWEEFAEITLEEHLIHPHMFICGFPQSYFRGTEESESRV